MARERILIAGAGIGGVAAALALARRGFDVSVYERAPELREVGAGLSVWPNATHVLQELGVLEAVAERAGFEQRIRVESGFRQRLVRAAQTVATRGAVVRAARRRLPPSAGPVTAVPAISLATACRLLRIARVITARAAIHRAGRYRLVVVADVISAIAAVESAGVRVLVVQTQPVAAVSAVVCTACGSLFLMADAVAAAAVHALSDPAPKMRYMVVATERQAEVTIRKAMEELVQLNHSHEFSYDREALIRMLDEALARVR